MSEFDPRWQRIVALQGETFFQKRGKPFRYRILGNSVVPTTTNRMLLRSDLARAFDRVPLRGPGELADLQGPSYLFAILTDPRVDGAGTASRVPDGIPRMAGRDTNGSRLQARSAGTGGDRPTRGVDRPSPGATSRWWAG